MEENDLTITEEHLRALPALPETPPLCLLCRHSAAGHVLIPPEDPRSRVDIRHYHGQASRAHALGKGHKPKRMWYTERQCIAGASTRGVCPCARLIVTEAEMAEFRASEAGAYQPPTKTRSAESDGRSKSNAEIRALERASRE